MLAPASGTRCGSHHAAPAAASLGCIGSRSDGGGRPCGVCGGAEGLSALVEAGLVEAAPVDAARVQVGEPQPGLRERLAGRRVFLTGATGFVGEALLERLLSDFPDLRLSVLVRARKGTSPTDRFAQLLDKPAFGRLRESRPVDELIAAVD